jgi:hypothetical protein
VNWEPVERWESQQPMRCTVCGETFVGKELTWMPVLCDHEGCPGPIQRQTVIVTPVVEGNES